MKFKTLLIIAFYSSFLVFCPTAAVTGDDYDYSFKSKGHFEDMKDFLRLRSKLQRGVREEERHQIRFAIGEYYFKDKAWLDANPFFFGVYFEYFVHVLCEVDDH